MKMELLKRFGKVFGMLAGIGAMSLVFTALFMVLLNLITGFAGGQIAEEAVTDMSGSLGIMATGLLTGIFARKKHYIVEKKSKANVAEVLGYIVLVLGINILLYSVTTVLFSKAFPLEAGNSYENVIVKVISGMLLAPFFEELLFRVGIYGYMRIQLGKVWGAIISTLIFALLHGYQLQGFLSCLTFSFCMVFVYEKTGRILYCMLIHM